MKKKFLLAPALWFGMILTLLVAWAVVSPEAAVRFFDQGGYSPFELATLPVFAAIVPLVWWKCPFEGSPQRRTILCTMVSVVAIMAIVKEMDLHLMALHALYPDLVSDRGYLLPGLYKPNGDALLGTPFKMRVLTNAAVPMGMKLFILAFFIAFFGTFAAGFAYLLKSWIVGVFKLVPSAWAVGCFGASGVMVQIADRLPSWLDHACGLAKTEGAVTSTQSLCTMLEEGGEMMIALFAILAIVLGHKENQR